MKASSQQTFFRILAILTMGQTLLPIVFENIFFPLSSKYFYLLAWVASTLLFYPKIYSRGKILTYYFFIAIYLFMSTIGLYNLSFFWFQRYLEPILFAVIIIDYFIISKDLSGLKVVLRLSLIFIAITTITSIIGLQQNPLVSRDMSGKALDVAEVQYYQSRGIAGYGFFYGIAFILPLIVHIIKKTQNAKKKYLLIILSALILWGIIEAQFATAFLVSLVGSSIVLFSNLKNLKVLWRLAFISFILILVPSFVYSGIIFWFADILPEGLLHSRIVDLGQTFEQGFDAAETHTGARAERVPILINSFLQSPIYGGGVNFYHNFWLDILSQFGLIGIIPWVFLLKVNIKENMKYMTKDYKLLYLLVMVLFIAIGFVKGMGQKVLMIFIFFIIPAFCLLYSKQETRKKTISN